MFNCFHSSLNMTPGSAIFGALIPLAPVTRFITSLVFAGQDSTEQPISQIDLSFMNQVASMTQVIPQFIGAF